MRDLKTQLTSGKNTNNLKSQKGKSFGYQVLGFGAGAISPAYDINVLVVAGGGSVAYNNGGGEEAVVCVPLFIPQLIQV